MAHGIGPSESAVYEAAGLRSRSPSLESGDAPAMTVAARKPASGTGPWRRILVIYAILALAVFAFPGGIVEWLDEHNTTGWLGAPLALAREIDAVSAATGVKAVGQGLRKRFSSIVGTDED